MMKSTIYLLSLLLIFTAAGIVYMQSDTSLPDIPGHLVYSRQVSEDAHEFIFLTGQQQRTFEISAEQCFALSPDAQHGVIYQDSLMTIFSLENQQTILSQPLPAETAPTTDFCNLYWQDENTVHFLTGTPEQPRTEFVLSLDTGRLEAITVGESRSLTSTALPDQLTGDLFPPLYSPSGDLVLYARCAPDGVNSLGNCMSTQVVVYNSATQQVIEVLENASGAILGEESEDFMLIVPSTAFWSPSGRYLLYAEELYPAAKLKLYDTQLDRYLDLPFPDTLTFDALFAGVEWLEGEQPQVGFWVFDTDTNASLGNPQRFIAYNLTLGGLNLSTHIFARSQSAGDWKWSPDGDAIALVNDENLLLLDLADDETTILDTGVSAIQMWVEE